MKKLDLPIIPAPRKIETLDGVYAITKETQLYSDPSIGPLMMTPYPEVKGRKGDIIHSQRLNRVSDLLENWFAPFDGYTRINLSDQQEGAGIVLSYQDSMEAEEYTLDVSQSGVIITASQGTGFFYGVQTLLQLVEEGGTIPCCHIEDSPEFFWRGLMLDCGRYFQPIERIKQFLDTMALHKLNVFHWHLTEDQGWRLEIEKYPKLTEVGSKRSSTTWGHELAWYSKPDKNPHGGFYRKNDVLDIVSYARNLGIMVVPEIDLPGHSRAAIAAYPELGVFGKSMDVQTRWGVCKDVYTPEESTITFLQGVFTEVLELFPSPWIHIGGDEVPKNQWKKSNRVKELLKSRGLASYDEMQSWFIGQIADFLKAQDRKVVGWDEIMDGGAPENATIMGWRSEKKCVEAAKKGLPVLLAPSEWTYLDYRESNNPFEPISITRGSAKPAYYDLHRVYQWGPVPKDLTESERALIMGGQGQVWTEYASTMDKAEYMTWPRASAIAERLWSSPSFRDFDQFCNRLKSMTSLLDKRGVIHRFQGDPIEGGTLSCDKERQTITIALDDLSSFPDTYRRIQLYFTRKSFCGYGKIVSVQLQTAEGDLLEDIHEGYVGRFNQLNVYTLGCNTLVKKGGSLMITLEASCEVPTLGKKVKPCKVLWAWKAIK